ncbi:lactonase family protein [Sphingobacterium yanglingense]|uniref:6-phosphogluconolactonase n=1 Tax=Sphingobacterium yanglingense TaxID=1437280 RepID=A0A4R6WGD8_9SPHI|nr:lactonase family protein [Sphingobacterium yanglingense]TDQ76710.1 6-phosphogluconolactonase [Sphingobacterium yanglingense]
MIDLGRMFAVFLGLSVPGFFLNVQAQTAKLYVGTYTSAGGSEGVQLYDFEAATGASTFSGTIPMDNPSFLARKGQMLYAVNENNEGRVTAIDLESRAIMGTLPTKGAHPCHVSLSPTKPVLVVSNYSSGSLALFSLKDDGSLNQEEDFIQFKGSSINKDRQSSSHIHSAFFSKDGSRLFVSDLGADLIYIYEIQQEGTRYSLQRVDSISTPKGSGPRHVVVSDDAKCIYAVLELTGEVAVFQQKNNQWVNTQVLPVYDEGFKGEHGGADIKMSVNGKFVYATNRGDANVIACYEVMKNKMLRLKSIVSTGGNSPRNLNISADGNWGFVTNQISNQISVFKRNTRTGALAINESVAISVSKPVCLIF